VRTYMGTVGDEKRGWFNALQDPQIGQALALIQHQPDEPWTVESLANHVSLSRSAFSAKFKQLVGQSPMQYVTRVRLTKAAALLRTNSATLAEVATSIGYDSEVAFSKAFRRYFGIAPGAYRQGKRPPTEAATLENGHQV
jgi:transcriptional regulator GlxA family with amidase domain